MAIFGAFGLFLFILAYRQDGSPSWTFWAWMEGFILLVAIIMFPLGKPDPVPRRPGSWDKQEDGLGSGLEKSNLDLIDVVERIF